MLHTARYPLLCPVVDSEIDQDPTAVGFYLFRFIWSETPKKKTRGPEGGRRRKEKKKKGEKKITTVRQKVGRW